METFVSLSRLAQKLNQTTDSYTQSLTDVEKQLREMNIGVEAWIEISETVKSGTPDRETSLRKMLGYSRVTDGWSLAVKTVRVERGCQENDPNNLWENIYEEEAPKPLLKASRDVRIEAAEHVPVLLAAIEGRVAQLIQSVEEAEARLQQFGRGGRAFALEPVLQWKCDSCGEMLGSPRDRCRCAVLKTNEGREINPLRQNVGKKSR
jgi:hypothetical protein